MIRVSRPIVNLVAWRSESLLHQLSIFGSSMRRWRKPRTEIDWWEFIGGPHDWLASLNYVLHCKRSARDGWQSFNGAEESARFRWNDLIPAL